MPTNFFAAICLIVLSADVAVAQADESTVQPLEHNVFLNHWQVFGPFPGPNGPAEEVNTTFIADEAHLQGGSVRFYNDELFTWHASQRAAVNFRIALKIPSSSGNNVVGYAYTEVFCDREQDVSMAIAHDDAMAAWVNGEEVSRVTEISTSGAMLDQTVADVTLKKGVNRILLKIANGTSGWHGAVRFRPRDAATPLFKFGARPFLPFSYMPTVTVELVDKQQNIFANYRVDTLRKEYSEAGKVYEVYGEDLTQTPDSAVFRIQANGFRPVTKTVKWANVKKGNVKLDLAADRPVDLLIVDAKTNRPIEGAEIWNKSGESTGVFTDKSGRATVADIPPGTNQCWAVAKGYAASSVKLKWPRSGIASLALTPGGRTLKGVVSSTDGNPIAGAIVSPGLSSGYAPTATTDELGQFEIFGIPEDRDRLYPTVVCPGYVSKDSFRQSLSENVTQVQWSLAVGASIVGRVTHKETGKPLAGIQMIIGTSRYSSNVKNPEAVTDTDGHYVLTGVETGSNIVHAFSDNHAPAMQTTTATAGVHTEVNFELQTGKSVTGRITDRDGNPISRVWVVTEEWNGARMFRRETRTDAEGRYELTHMPDTDADVSVLKQKYIAHRDVKMRGGAEINLTMMPEITHTVTIRSASTGKIVPQLTINKGYQWNGGKEYSWSTSHYETDRYYDALTGTMKIEIDEPMNSPIAYRFRATGFREQILRIPKQTDVGQTFEINLQPTKMVTARVIDADTGQPLQGIAVAVVNSNDRMRYDHYSDFRTAWQHLQENRFTGEHTTTDSQGIFQLTDSSTDGQFDFVLINPDGGFVFIQDGGQHVANSTFADEPGTPQFDLPFPSCGEIGGRLTVAGKPVADSAIRMQWLDHGIPISRDDRQLTFGMGGQVRSDSNGEFDFGKLGPGRYRIQQIFSYTHPGTRNGGNSSMYLAGEEIVLAPGQALEYNLEKPPGFTLSGTTLDADGTPLPQCVLTVTDGNNSFPVAAMLSGPDGKFLFEHLPQGTYKVRATHYVPSAQYSGRTDASALLTVKLNESRTDFAAVLQKTTDRQQIRPATIVGTLAPHFTASPHGAASEFILPEQSDRVTAICFWSPWSDDIEAINAAFENHKDNKSVRLITVFSGHDVNELTSVMNKHGYEFPVIFQDQTDLGGLTQLFGRASYTGCFIVGRDGRFVSEAIQGQGLDAAITSALKATTVPIWDKRPGQLRVQLSADDGPTGVPGAMLSFKITLKDGNTLMEDKYNLQGVVRDVIWRHPPIPENGQLSVTVSGAGIEEHQHEVQPQQLSETLAISVPSPRRITGQVVSITDAAPISNINVRLQASHGWSVSGATNDDGKFSIPCFPSHYYTTGISNEQFAVAQEQPATINVTDDFDPEPLEFEASVATIVEGRVVDATNTPVSDAQVLLAIGQRTTTDADGNFTISRVPSEGKVQLWASKDGVYGSIALQNPDVNTSYTIKLGENNEQFAAEELVDNRTLSPLEMTTLQGEPITWTAQAESNRLIVVCALWKPASAALLTKAAALAADHNAALEVISLDWSLPQAQREAQRLGLRNVQFAGVPAIALREKWKMSTDSATFLIAPDGTLLENPF